MKRIIKTFLSGAMMLASLVFVSCETGGTTVISNDLSVSCNFTEINNMGLTSSGVKPQIEVNSEVYWQLNIIEGAEWLSTDIVGGSGSTTIALVVTEHTGEEARTAKICFETLNGEPQYIDIVQNGLNEQVLFWGCTVGDKDANGVAVNDYRGWGYLGINARDSRITGDNASISNATPSNNYDAASGGNYVVLEGNDSHLLVENIPTDGRTEFAISFGAKLNEDAVVSEKLQCLISVDGEIWSEIPYSSAKSEEWSLVSFNFGFVKQCTDFMIKFQSASETPIFLDDISVYKYDYVSDTRVALTIKLNYVEIPAGTFTMGSPSTEKNRYADEVEHQVTISKPFLMTDFPITNKEFTSFLNAVGVGSDGMYDTEEFGRVSMLSDNDHQWTIKWDKGSASWALKNDDYGAYPVCYVSWYGANEFAKWVGGALPTEAQWEYACRAGTTTPVGIGNGQELNSTNCNVNYKYSYDGNNKGQYNEGVTSLYRTTPKGGILGDWLPNAWGLYDMHGNVWEWCSDWYAEYSTESATDPTGPSTGTTKVVRGGSFSNGAAKARSATREKYEPTYTWIIGFRVVKEL